MSRKRIVPEQMHSRFEAVARQRLLTPSNKELAREAHCSEATVEFYIAQYMRKLRQSLISCGADAERMGRQHFAD